jgi:hypothetical protein
MAQPKFQEECRIWAKLLGSRGGLRGMANRTPEQRHELAKLGAASRWAKQKEQKRAS